MTYTLTIDDEKGKRHYPIDERDISSLLWKLGEQAGFTEEDVGSAFSSKRRAKIRCSICTKYGHLGAACPNRDEYKLMDHGMRYLSPTEFSILVEMKIAGSDSESVALELDVPVEVINKAWNTKNYGQYRKMSSNL